MITILGIDPGASNGFALLRLDARSDFTHLRSGATRDIEEILGLFDDLADPRPDVIAIETGRSVYPKKGFGPRMAGHLMAASHGAGRILGVAQTRRIETWTATCGEWRRALCMRAAASDTMVKQYVGARVRSWPARSSNHARDAAGVAVFVGIRRKIEPRWKAMGAS